VRAGKFALRRRRAHDATLRLKCLTNTYKILG
jgi:hypothetical protein